MINQLVTYYLTQADCQKAKESQSLLAVATTFWETYLPSRFRIASVSIAAVSGVFG